MVSSSIPEALRALVRERADHRCEYCLIPEYAVLVSHEIDHVVARKHGGKTELSNLAFCCRLCNRHKGTDLTSIDPEDDAVVLLYNPRRDTWNEHFQLEHTGVIKPLTATGRTTVRLLQFNRASRAQERRLLVESGEI